MTENMHELTQILRKAIEAVSGSYSRETLIESGRTVSERYRMEKGERRRLAKEQEAAAYAVSRMPATYGAAHFALLQGIRAAHITSVESHLDCGAGTGAVVLAAADLLMPKQVYLLEREAAMISVGQSILDACGISGKYYSGNLCDTELPCAELVTEGYVLSELSKEQREKAILNMWHSTGKILVLIEPGTMEGFSIIRNAKEILRENGAFLVAPCVASECPIEENDWCHFSVRVSRSQLHRYIKGGEAPFEDEKFCYAVFTRELLSAESERIIRHPMIAAGRISLELCTKNGRKTRVVTKKDPLWKRARKAEWGECLS